MLEVDPMKRITIPEIRQHPWFQHKLPPYLRHSPDMMELVDSRPIDEDVIDQVCRIPFTGVTRDLVMKAAGERMDMACFGPSLNYLNNRIAQKEATGQTRHRVQF